MRDRRKPFSWWRWGRGKSCHVIYAHPMYTFSGDSCIFCLKKMWICCFHLVVHSCSTLCDPMNCSTPGFPVFHSLLEFAQTHIHWIADAIPPSHPLSSPSPPAFPSIRVFSNELALFVKWPKKAEHQRIDTFELWCWRRLLRVPWTARRSNKSILKEINPEYYWKGWCWSWSSNTLAACCEEPTCWERPCCLEKLRAGEGDKR